MKEKFTKDRFDLEDEISALYAFSQQLDTLSEGILERDMSTDDIANAIIGLKVLIELQAQKLHDTMSQCFRLNEYKDQARVF
jgi:hypothetical protein